MKNPSSIPPTRAQERAGEEDEELTTKDQTPPSQNLGALVAKASRGSSAARHLTPTGPPRPRVQRRIDPGVPTCGYSTAPDEDGRTGKCDYGFIFLPEVGGVRERTFPCPRCMTEVTAA